MATFTYVPDYSAQVASEPRVDKVSFGDGYESRQSPGLNTDLEKWSVQFKTSPTTANTIFTWLRARKAVEAFNWTTPDGNALVFVCDSVTKSIDSIGWQTVNAVFRQVPETALP